MTENDTKQSNVFKYNWYEKEYTLITNIVLLNIQIAHSFGEWKE